MNHSSLHIQPYILICICPLGQDTQGLYLTVSSEHSNLCYFRKVEKLNFELKAWVWFPKIHNFSLCLVRQCNEIFSVHANQVIITMSTSFMPTNASLHVPIWGSAHVLRFLKFSFWSFFLVNLLRYAWESPLTKNRGPSFWTYYYFF